jgi:hypothetical protein
MLASERIFEYTLRESSPKNTFTRALVMPGECLVPMEDTKND